MVLAIGARAAVDLAVLAEQRGFASVFMVEGVLSNRHDDRRGNGRAHVSDRDRNGHREARPASADHRERTGSALTLA